MAQSRPSEKRQASGQVREDCPLSKALPPDVLGVSKGPFLDNGTVGTQKTEGVGGDPRVLNQGRIYSWIIESLMIEDILPGLRNDAPATTPKGILKR